MDMVPTKCQSSDTINEFTKSVMMTILIQIGEESWTNFFMCLKYSNTNWTPQSTRSCHLQMEKLGTKEFTNLDSCEYDFCQMTFKPRFCYQMSMAVVYQEMFPKIISKFWDCPLKDWDYSITSRRKLHGFSSRIEVAEQIRLLLRVTGAYIFGFRSGMRILRVFALHQGMLHKRSYI